MAGLVPGQCATLERLVKFSRGHLVNMDTHTHTHTSVDRQIVLGDSAGEISVMFHPRRGGADIQSDPLSRVTSKAR